MCRVKHREGRLGSACGLVFLSLDVVRVAKSQFKLRLQEIYKYIHVNMYIYIFIYVVTHLFYLFLNGWKKCMVFNRTEICIRHGRDMWHEPNEPSWCKRLVGIRVRNYLRGHCHWSAAAVRQGWLV